MSIVGGIGGDIADRAYCEMLAEWATLLGDSMCDSCGMRLRNKDKRETCIMCIKRMQARKTFIDDRVYNDPINLAMCDDDDVDSYANHTSRRLVCGGRSERSVDSITDFGISYGRKRPQREGQRVNLKRIPVIDADGNPVVDAKGRFVEKVRIAGQVTSKKITPLPEGTISIGSTPEDCVEEFRERMRHAEYGEGSSKDGSLYKYARSMVHLFKGDGFFKTRDDFFKDGAKAAAYAIFMNIAKQKVKDPNDQKKIDHEMRCLKHGFDDFVYLVSGQTVYT